MGQKQKSPSTGDGLLTDAFDCTYLSAHARSAPIEMTVEMMNVMVRGETKHDGIVGEISNLRNCC